MKQKISAPIAAAVAVVVLGLVSFVLWQHYIAPPSAPEKTVSPAGLIKPGMKRPTNRAEGMAMFRGGHYTPPSPEESAARPAGMGQPGFKPPTNREEAMRMFHGGH